MKGPYPPTAREIPADAVPTREPMRYVPQLSHTERERRWERVRKKMALQGLDALILLGTDISWGMGMANLRYLLQVDNATGAEGLFPLDGEPVAWSGASHVNRPTNMMHSVQDWVADQRSRGGIRAVAAELRDRGLSGSRIGVVGYSSAIQT